MALAYESNVPAAYRAAFVSKVVSIAARLLIDPNWLMIVMQFETAGKFTADVKNPNSSATGLIQFTTVAATDIGTTTAKLAAMSAVDQLDYVEKYLTRYKGKMTDVYKTYLAVFSPAYILSSNAQVVFKNPTAAYTANKSLDTDKDGTITVGEIKQVISRYIPSGVSSGVTPVTEIVENALPIGVLGAVGLGLYLLFKQAQ